MAGSLGGWCDTVHLPACRRTATEAVLSFVIMASDPSSSPDSERRVVRFRRAPASARPAASVPPPVDDLAKFERSAEPDDYRHRMMVNAAAFLFVVALIGAGLWLADTMAALRRNQDCVLAGHRNCTPVEVSKDRW
jgi:hypothetical protein